MTFQIPSLAVFLALLLLSNAGHTAPFKYGFDGYVISNSLDGSLDAAIIKGYYLFDSDISATYVNNAGTGTNAWHFSEDISHGFHIEFTDLGISLDSQTKTSSNRTIEVGVYDNWTDVGLCDGCDYYVAWGYNFIAEGNVGSIDFSNLGSLAFGYGNLPMDTFSGTDVISASNALTTLPALSGVFRTPDFDTQLTFITTDFYQMSVPVPAAIWLFGTGLLGLIGVARRKKS